MKKLIFSLGILGLGTFGLFVQCTDETDVYPKSGTQNNVVGIESKTTFTWKPASTEEEFFQLIKDSRVNIIRSSDDFIRRTQQKGTVYAKLDQETIKEFVKDLKFKNRGLSTARYSKVRAVLTQKEYFEFWGGFGLDPWFLADHYEYRCESAGNCKSDDDYICTSNC